MHGQDYRGRPCGSFGDLSIFSFYPNKHVTTGEGGMIVTDDDGLAERCRGLRNLCFQPGKRRFVHEELGWNLRMSNLQAAVGVAQLERLDEFVARKRRMGRRYTELLAGVPGLELPVARTPVRRERLLGLRRGAHRRRAVRRRGGDAAPGRQGHRHAPVLLADAPAAGVSAYGAVPRRPPPGRRAAGGAGVLPAERAGAQGGATSPGRRGGPGIVQGRSLMAHLGLYLGTSPHAGGMYQYELSVIRGLAPLLDAGWTVTAFAHDDSWRADLPAGFRLVVRPKGSPVPGRRLPADVSSPRCLPLAYSGGWTRWSGPSMRPAATWSPVQARTPSATNSGAAPWSRSTT